MQAYDTGCKGCTTYRPNEVTGSVLSVASEEKSKSEKKIQLRFKGTVEIFHKNSITKQRWDNVTPSSKRCYMGPYNPSDILEEYHPNIPDNVQFQDPTDQDSISGYNNFVIIRCHFYEIDFFSKVTFFKI